MILFCCFDVWVVGGRMPGGRSRRKRDRALAMRVDASEERYVEERGGTNIVG
jgi:hypothetical protein